MWVECAILCERLHVLPQDGSLFEQDPRHLRRLLLTFNQFDKYENEQVDARTKPQPQPQPPKG